MATSVDSQQGLLPPSVVAAEWEEAVRLFCSSDYRSAVQKFELLLRNLSNSTAANRVESRSQEEVARLTDPQLLAKLWFNIGAIYSPLDDNALAIDAFKSATLIDEDSALAWYAIGIEQYKSGEFKEAYEAFDRSKGIFDSRENKDTRIRVDKYEMDKKFANSLMASRLPLIKSNWPFRRSMPDTNLRCTIEVMKNPNTGKESLPTSFTTIPMGVLHGPPNMDSPNKVLVYGRGVKLEDIIDRSCSRAEIVFKRHMEVKEKLKEQELLDKAIREQPGAGEIVLEAKTLRRQLAKDIQAEERATTGVGRSMSEGAASRSKPLPKLPDYAKDHHGNAFVGSDEDPELNPSSVYTSLHTSAKLVSPYDSHGVKKENEEDSAGLLDHSKRHTTPHDLKLQLPRSGSVKGEEALHFKHSPSTASTTKTFGSPVFSAKASPLVDTAFTFTPPTQVFSDGPQTSIKTSFNLSPKKSPSASNSPSKGSSPPKQSLTEPFRGPEPPWQLASDKIRIREHHRPAGPGQWLWRPDAHPFGVRASVHGEWVLRFPNNRNCEVIPALPSHMLQPGEWVWDLDTGYKPELTPDLPPHLIKPGESQPCSASKANGDMLFTLDLESIAEENVKETQAVQYSRQEDFPTNQAPSRTIQQNSHVTHESPRMKGASPLRQVFSANDHYADQFEEQSAFIPLNLAKAQADNLSLIPEEDDDFIPKPRTKSKLRTTVGLFDGSWHKEFGPDDVGRYSVAFDSQDGIAQRWQDQLIPDPPTSLSDDPSQDQGTGLGITDQSDPLFTNLMKDLTESNGGRQVVEEAYNTLISGGSPSASTPRMRGSFAKRSNVPLTPRTEYQESLYNFTPKLFQDYEEIENKSSKSKTPTFADIDYKHQSFLPTFELKPTVFEGFAAYNTASQTAPAKLASSETVSAPAVSTPKEPLTPKGAPSTPKAAPATPKAAPSTPKVAPSTPKAAPSTPKVAPSTPKNTSPPKTPMTAKKASSPTKAPSTPETSTSPLVGMSPKKETAYDSDASAESDDTARNVSLRRRSRKESPPSYHGFRLKHVPNKQFATKPENAGFRARKRSNEDDAGEGSAFL